MIPKDTKGEVDDGLITWKQGGWLPGNRVAGYLEIGWLALMSSMKSKNACRASKPFSRSPLSIMYLQAKRVALSMSIALACTTAQAQNL